jgi:ceramide glucosyltransferase
MIILVLCVMVLVTECAFMVIGFQFFENSRTEIRSLPYFWGDVSILKPLKGISPSLRENLLSFFRLQSVGKIQIIFLIEDEKDEVVPFLEAIVSEISTHHEILIKKGLPLKGRNPKNSNLFYGFENARYDWIYISDADVWVEPSHVEKLLKLVGGNADTFVSTIPLATRPGTVSAALQAVGLNLDGIQYFAICDRLKKPLIFGGSNFFHRGLALRTQVFAKCLDLISEDLAMARAFAEVEARGRILAHAVRTPVGDQSFPSFHRLWVRWLAITRTMAPQVFWPAPLNWWWQGFFIAGLFMGMLPYLKISAFFLGLRMFRLWLYLNYCKASKAATLKQLLALPLFDLIVPFFWVQSVFTNVVYFGGKQLRFNNRGEILPK